jgi:hypothetical protein
MFERVSVIAAAIRMIGLLLFVVTLLNSSVSMPRRSLAAGLRNGNPVGVCASFICHTG